LLQAFDPNEWCLKNGLLSGGLNPRPLSHESSALTTIPRLLASSMTKHLTFLIIYPFFQAKCELEKNKIRRKAASGGKPKKSKTTFLFASNKLLQIVSSVANNKSKNYLEAKQKRFCYWFCVRFSKKFGERKTLFCQKGETMKYFVKKKVWRKCET